MFSELSKAVTAVVRKMSFSGPTLFRPPQHKPLNSWELTGLMGGGSIIHEVERVPAEFILNKYRV
jgi:hypothetical protein